MLDKVYAKKRNDPEFMKTIAWRVCEPREERVAHGQYWGLLIDYFPAILSLIGILLLIINPFSIFPDWYRVISFILIVLLFIFYLYTLLIKFNKFEKNEERLFIKGLKSEIKIAFISDIHSGDKRFGMGIEKIKKVVETINDFKPDIFLVGGDFIEDRLNPNVTQVLKELKNVKCNLKYGVYGNHDAYYMDNGGYLERPLESIKLIEENTGIKILINEGLNLNVKNDSIYLAGLDDLYTKLTNLDIALSGNKNNSTCILLSHSPDIIDFLIKGDKVDLILSGHNHAGQIRLPLFGNLLPMPSNHKWLVKGLYKIDENINLYLSQGIGHTGTRLRFGTSTEVNLLTICPPSN